jgi:predicted nucleic acid-binding protein
MKPSERYATQKLLSRMATYNLDRDTADRAGDLIRHSREKGMALSVPDSIIAATAIGHNLTLVTLNRSHFDSIAGLSLYPISEEDSDLSRKST